MNLTDYSTIARGWRAVAAITAVLAAAGAVIAASGVVTGHDTWVHRGLILLVACGVASVLSEVVARMYTAADDTDIEETDR